MHLFDSGEAGGQAERLRTAVRGQGVALVRSPFLQDYVASGDLVMPFPGLLMPSGYRHVLVRHPQAARRLYEWALTPQAQQFAFAARGFQVPSNKATPLDPRVPDIGKLKLINYDYARYGQPAERARIIKAWDEKLRSLPN